MFKGVKVKVVYYEIDFVELEVIVANERYSGTARLYCGRDDVRELGWKLSGFPKEQDDCRQFELGSLNPEYAGGCLSLKFSCVDKSCHVFVAVRLISDSQESRLKQPQMVSLEMPVEPAAVDRFSRELMELRIETSAVAELCMAT